MKLLEVTDIVITWIVVIIPQVYMYIKTHQVVYFKYVQFLVYQLYLNKAVVVFFKGGGIKGRPPGSVSSLGSEALLGPPASPLLWSVLFQSHHVLIMKIH